MLSPVLVIYKKVPISGLVNKGLQAVKGKISLKQKLEKPAVEVLLENTKWTVKIITDSFLGPKNQIMHIGSTRVDQTVKNVCRTEFFMRVWCQENLFSS